MEPTQREHPPHHEPEEIADLRSAATRVRELVASYEREQDAAWQAYAHSIDRALVHLEIELEVSAAHLAVLRAESADDLSRTLERARTSWSALGDELRLQAHLGELDARDVVGATYERAGQDLAHAGAAIQSTLDALVHLPATAAHDLAPVRERAAGGVAQLRSALFGLRLALSRSEPPELPELPS